MKKVEYQISKKIVETEGNLDENEMSEFSGIGIEEGEKEIGRGGGKGDNFTKI